MGIQAVLDPIIASIVRGAGAVGTGLAAGAAYIGGALSLAAPAAAFGAGGA